jgi:FHA domain
MDITCPNCHQVVKSTDGFCESCWFKIDNIGDNSSNYPSLTPKPAKEAPLLSLSAGIVRKVCKNQKCANYNTEYDIDDNYCGVCGFKLALEEKQQEQEQEKPPDLQKRGFLVTPDKSQIEVTTTQIPIGRIHLSKYVSEGNMNYISKVHFTVFKEEEKYFIQDGKTAVQEKPSRNKTWLISGGQQKEEITEKGRRELKEGDQISVADVVTLSFTLKYL